MSWSINIIGKPAKVAEALDAQSAKMEGQSKLEFDDALPHMKALVEQNFGNDSLVLKLNASGHGYAVGNEQKTRNFVCAIEALYATLAV